jgi:hypothetical protein
VRACVFAFAIPLLNVHTANAQRTLGITVQQGASDFRQQAGKRLTFVCPASDGSNAPVYGTDTYAEFSKICAAAIHAGVLSRGQAGMVSIVIAGAVDKFNGSARNGIASQNYGAWSYSFTFSRDSAPGTIAWTTLWSQMPPGFADSIAVRCPAGGSTAGPLWGTDIYTNDSAICVAAVHAGAITAAAGGVVTIAGASNAGPFPASERHGIASKQWGSAPSAFRVVVAATSGAAQVATGTGQVASGAAAGAPVLGSGAAGTIAQSRAATSSIPAPRTITLPSGFTAASAYATVAPRTITVATGFTASGALFPPSRKIMVKTGWTATGK